MRSNMIYIGDHCYRVGPSVMMMLTAEQTSALNCESSYTCECFFRLFKDGEMYHSTSYKERMSLRNDTVCFFKHDDSVFCGIITVFVVKPPVPVGLINVLCPKDTSLINHAGNPCRETLLPYKNVDLLENFCTH